MKVSYQRTYGLQLLTKCKHYPTILVGGGECASCPFFAGKNMETQEVTCYFRMRTHADLAARIREKQERIRMQKREWYNRNRKSNETAQLSRKNS